MENSTVIAQSLPGGGGIGPSFAREAGAQSWGQGRHDQALVGGERSRVGIRLGFGVFSKADDPPSSSSVAQALEDRRLWRDRQHGNAQRGIPHSWKTIFCAEFYWALRLRMRAS